MSIDTSFHNPPIADRAVQDWVSRAMAGQPAKLLVLGPLGNATCWRVYRQLLLRLPMEDIALPDPEAGDFFTEAGASLLRPVVLLPGLDRLRLDLSGASPAGHLYNSVAVDHLLETLTSSRSHAALVTATSPSALVTALGEDLAKDVLAWPTTLVAEDPSAGLH